jgi:hypothetical protein
VAVEGTVNRYRRWAGGVRRFRPSGNPPLIVVNVRGTAICANSRQHPWKECFLIAGSYYSLVYCALAYFRTGMSGSASFPKGKEDVVSGSGVRGLVGR